MGKSERDFNNSEYDGINFKSDKRKKNKFVRRNVKNILKNIDLNNIEEDLDLFEDFEE